MNDYIYKSNLVYDNINTSIDDFYDEARVIEYAKCALINKQDLNDFIVDEIDVSVDFENDTYHLYYNDIELCLKVKDNLIYDYNRE